ncbi:Uncharacterised protein g3019 [Pycnogonum litorale]
MKIVEKNRDCKCKISLVDQTGIVVKNVTNVTLMKLQDCESPLARKECREECNKGTAFLSRKSVFTNYNEDGQMIGNVACKELQLDFDNLKAQNFVDICEENNYRKGNQTSEPLSCKNGVMKQ